MKYSFYVMSTDGYPLFPMELGGGIGGQGDLVSKWTLNIDKAVLWDKPEDFDCLMAEFDSVLIGVKK